MLGATTMVSGVFTTRTANAAALASATALRQLYTSLTQATGGIVVPVTSSSSASAALRRLLDEFRSSYVLYFTLRDVKGGFHTLEVTVPQNSRFTVRARRGYWGE